MLATFVRCSSSSACRGDVAGASPLAGSRVDVTERFLLRVLRRDITWCARREGFAQMQGAAQLFADC
jgi:hypothetical protein